MDEKMKRLDLIISSMINSFIYEPDYFVKLYDEFVIEYYKKLDENNKDEYYHKVKQTYLIFSALINEKETCELLVNTVQNEDILKKILYTLYGIEYMSHKDLAEKLGITYEELNKFIDKVYSFGVIYDLGCGKFDYVYSLTKKGKNIVNILKSKELI